MIAQSWRKHWEHIVPFLALPAELRKAVYTTNTIEALHRQIRKAIKNRGHFPDEQAATKLIYLAIERSAAKLRSVRTWTAALAALKIHFGDRLPRPNMNPVAPAPHTVHRTPSVGAGETVVDVPSALAARARVLQTGHGRKTDGIDARSVALVAQQRDDLQHVSAEDHSGVLRLLADRRDELTAERRRAVNRLHRLLRDLRPGGAPLRLSADRAAQLLATIRPSGAVDSERKAMARQLIADVRRSDRALTDNRRRCAQTVAATATTLTQICGVRDVLAAKLLGHTGDITRFASADHYASYTGTAPIEVSSGEQTRHRLSRAGNRSLNNALHLAARVQTMHPGPGRTRYQRKRAEQKTPPEALRKPQTTTRQDRLPPPPRRPHPLSRHHPGLDIEAL